MAKSSSVPVDVINQMIRSCDKVTSAEFGSSTGCKGRDGCKTSNGKLRDFIGTNDLSSKEDRISLASSNLCQIGQDLVSLVCPSSGTSRN